MSEAAEIIPIKQESLIESASPLAIVLGEPFFNAPHDLYIPPSALMVILESFEGPLDLLLYLIRRQNFNILDIPVAQITKQYVQYVILMKDLNLELAAEYLVMAAILGEIKSRCLLPRQQAENAEEDDPRADLVRRLQEYAAIKFAAQALDQIPRLDREIRLVQVAMPNVHLEKADPEVSLSELMTVVKNMLARAELFESHYVKPEVLSIREKMIALLSTIRTDQFTSFEDIFVVEEGRQGVVVTFLAILQLVKEQLVDIVQVETFGMIYVRGRGGDEEAVEKIVDTDFTE